MLMKIHDIETDCLESLIDAKFIIPINKVVVVRHWLLNNQVESRKKRVSHKFWGTLFFFAKSCSFILPCRIFFVSLHL